MTQDIEKALAYQVKREIAQRYFRLRKLIQDDTSNVRNLIKELNQTYQTKLRPELLRIYSLLVDRDLIEEFCQYLGLKEPPFMEEFQKTNWEERLARLRELDQHGWFKQTRFINLLMDSYTHFYKEWEEYYDQREEILDELAIIQEELSQFTRNYSLDDIMQLIRNIDQQDEAERSIGGNIEGRKLGELDKKMDLHIDLDSLREMMPELDKIPSLDQIKGKLKRLGKEAYARHRDRFYYLV